MLTKDNKMLFKNPKNNKKTKNGEIEIPMKMDIDKNIINHKDCILQMENLYMKLHDKDKYYIELQSKNKADYNIIKSDYNNLKVKNKNLTEDNRLLKKQIDELKKIINKDIIINDDLLYIDFDIFNESHYELERQNNYYEKQMDILNSFFKNNNINGLQELKTIINTSILNANNYNYIYKKYDNINIILEDVNINFQSQKLKINELLNNYKKLDNRIKHFKNKLKLIPIGTIITFNGVKKIYKGKIEKTIDKIKNMEEEYEEYCQKQISWAKKIIGDNYSDNEIIKLLDIYNKLIKEDKSNSSDSECDLDVIVNKYKNIKIQEYEMLTEFGNSFINNNINDKSQIKNFIKNNKHIIYSYDSKDKINRFISTCKRLYKLSQIIEINNIIKSKCQTNIRDMNNIEFDNLLKLIENKDKNE